MQDLLGGATLILLAACSLAVVATAAFRVPALLGYSRRRRLAGPLGHRRDRAGRGA